MKALCHDIIFRKDGIALESSLEEKNSETNLTYIPAMV